MEIGLVRNPWVREGSMQTEALGRDAVMMLSHRFVRHIEDRSEALASGLLHKLQRSTRTEAFRKVPPDELTDRVSEIYRHLGEWLLDKSESDIEQRYTQIGVRRAQQGVPLSQLIWAIMLTKTISGSSFWMTPIRTAPSKSSASRNCCSCSTSSLSGPFTRLP